MWRSRSTILRARGPGKEVTKRGVRGKEILDLSCAILDCEMSSIINSKKCYKI